jgi:hypothetical protein
VLYRYRNIPDKACGKTKLLREVVPVLYGHRVILLASTSASEKKLKKDFPEAVTLQKFERDTGLRDSARGSVDQGFSVCCVLATGDFARANPLPYSKAIQIGTNICQTNTKPWNKESPISNSI